MAQPAAAPRWGDAETQAFLDGGRYFVPARETQVATVCALVPDGATRLVELCCGEGLLTRALLERFPQARVLALDGSDAMLATTRRLAGPHAGRLETQAFDLGDRSWRQLAEPADAIVSSLAIHHLDGPGKAELFADMARILAPGGALIIADVMAPTHAPGTAVAADAWDEAVRQRAMEIDGTLDAWSQFQALGWNMYRADEPDSIDKPSSVFEQLRWLEEAGLVGADVHWMLAGHAILGARKPGP